MKFQAQHLDTSILLEFWLHPCLWLKTTTTKNNMYHNPHSIFIISSTQPFCCQPLWPIPLIQCFSFIFKLALRGVITREKFFETVGNGNSEEDVIKEMQAHFDVLSKNVIAIDNFYAEVGEERDDKIWSILVDWQYERFDSSLLFSC